MFSNILFIYPFMLWSLPWSKFKGVKSIKYQIINAFSHTQME